MVQRVQKRDTVEELYEDMMEYFQQSNATRFFEEMERIRRAWEGFYPLSRLGRNGIILLGMAAIRERRGHPYITVGQLAHVSALSLAGVSQKVSTLVDQGYLERVSSPSDRRVSCVQITEKGRGALHETAEALHTRIEHVLDHLGQERAERLFFVMRELSDAIYSVHKEENRK